MGDKSLFLEILTPEKTLFRGNVLSIQLPGAKGPFTLLFNHAPLISVLTEGHIRVIDTNHDTHIYDITDGGVDLKENRVVILTQPNH